MKTPRANVVEPMGDGKFHYIEIKQNLLRYLHTDNTFNSNKLILDFNIIELRGFKSTNKNGWLILCSIANFPIEDPIILAVFYGKSKPPKHEYYLTLL